MGQIASAAGTHNAEGLVSLDKGDLSAAMESFEEALRIEKENDPNSLNVATFSTTILEQC